MYISLRRYINSRHIVHVAFSLSVSGNF